MTVYRCDRCSKDAAQLARVGFIAVPDNRLGIVATGDSPEICERCVRELKEWLKPVPQLAKMVNR